MGDSSRDSHNRKTFLGHMSNCCALGDKEWKSMVAHLRATLCCLQGLKT